MGKIEKIVISVVAVIVALAVAATGFMWYALKSDGPSPIRSTQEGHFEDITTYGAENFFPVNYNQYDDVNFTTLHETSLIFESYSLKMEIHDKDDFEALKAEVERFQISKYEDRKFYYKSFNFTVADYSDYPKYFGTVGISEETKTVYFLWHYDQDLDYIDNFEKFIVDYFKL